MKIFSIFEVWRLLSRGHAASFGDDGAFYRASWWGVVCWEEFLNLIIKLWLMFRSRHLVLWSLGIYGLWESGKGTVCARRRHMNPQCTLPKVSCIIVWLFFLSRISIRWSFLRFKVDLSSWESLYLIGLNPNRFKVWILTSYFYTLYL
jgi:hypothetical protein